MMDITNRMKNKVREEGIELTAGADLFDLLAVACSQCCTDSEGGNKTCPPPPKLN
jgi:hypothetical protein